MSSIFISHSNTNNAEALALREWLVGQGWDNLFLDIDPKRGIVAGDRWRKALVDAGGRTKATLFVITPSWLESEECRTEFRIASGHDQPLFGVIGAATELSSIPNEMTSQWQLVDLTKGDEFETFAVKPPPEFQASEVRYSKHGLESLRQGLLKLGLISLETTSFPWPADGYEKDDDGTPRAPWRGLRAIDEPDAGVFFGRHGDLHRAMNRLSELRSTGGRKLWVILGASGAGKSSFMRAGLLPRLKRTERDYCVLPIIRPEGAVINGRQGLVASVERGLRDQGITVERASLRKELQEDTAALSRRLAEIQNAASAALPDEPKAPSLVLPLDQAEELFQPTATEAKQFITALAETLLYGPEAIVIATIRTDAYAPLQSSEPLRDLQVTFSLPPMGRGDYRATIEGPAERVTMAGRELTVTPILVERLVADAEGSDALPLLAFTLERLYRDYGGDNRLDDADYDDLGGIKGAVKAAVKAAFDKPEEAPRIPSDPAERRDLLYQAFPWLVGIDESNSAALRRVAHWDDIPAEAHCLIERLVNRRLLRTDEDDNKRKIVEIAHEALLRQWRTLTDWLDQEKDNLRAVQAVERAARDWDEKGREADWLLHKAGRLVTAEDLKAKRPDLAARWGDAGQRYLEACRAAENAEIDAERARQRRLLEEQRRRMRWAVSLSVVALLAAGIAAWQYAVANRERATAVEQRLAAEEQAAVANSRQLASQARLRIQSDPDLAMLLAVEAVRVFPSAESQSTLLASLQSYPFLETILHGHGSTVSALAFTPDGNLLVSSSCSYVAFWDCSPELGFWDTRNDTLLRMVETTDFDYVKALAFSPDGILLASLSVTRREGEWDSHLDLGLWDARNGTLVRIIATYYRSKGAVGLLWSADSKRLVIGNDNCSRFYGWVMDSAEVVPLGPSPWDFLGETEEQSDPTAVCDQGDTVQSPDGRWRASFECLDRRRAGGHCVRSEIHLLDETEQTEVAFRTGRVDSVAFRPGTVENARLASGECGVRDPNGRCLSGEVRIWNGSGAIALSQPLSGHGGWWGESFLPPVAFSSDGRIIGSAGNGGKGAQTHIILWNAVTLEPMATIQAGQSAVSIGEYRITTNQSTRDGPFIVQDLHRSDGPLMALRVGTTDVAQSPEAGLRATADGTTIILEDMGVDGQPVILEHDRTVRCLALSPDGQLLVSGHGGTLTFWDLRSSVPAGQPVLAQDGEVFSIAFSPDGSRLASGSGDGAIRLWDVPSREPIGDPLRKHNNSAVFNLSFSPDGNRLLSSGCAEWYVHLQCLAGEVFVWDLDVASWQERACRIANRNLTQTEWTRYFDAEAYRSTCPALPPGE